MLNRLRRPADLAVEATPDTVDEGDEVTVAVSGRFLRDVEVAAGTVQLVRHVDYKYDEKNYDNKGNAGLDTLMETETVTEDEVVLYGPGHHASGTPIDQRVRFAVPPGAMGSAKGEIITVRWEVEARIWVPKARDARATAAVRVCSLAADCRDDATLPPYVNGKNIVDLAFAGVPRSLATGDPLRGTLEVTPARDFGARGVRVELVRLEEVTREEGKHAETVVVRRHLDEDVVFAAGQPRSFPFAIDVPRDAPSLRGLEYTLGWALRGVVDRKLRGDPVIDLPLHIATARPSAGAPRQG